MVKVGRKPKKKDMEHGLKRVKHIYHTRGLIVTQVNTDTEFEYIRDEIRPVNTNIVTDREHVGDTERPVRTIKDGKRWHVHRLPYKIYPKKW